MPRHQIYIYRPIHSTKICASISYNSMEPFRPRCCFLDKKMPTCKYASSSYLDIAQKYPLTLQFSNVEPCRPRCCLSHKNKSSCEYTSSSYLHIAQKYPLVKVAVLKRGIVSPTMLTFTQKQVKLRICFVIIFIYIAQQYPPSNTALNIKLLEPLAQGASRFEKLLAPRKIYWPPFFPDRRLHSWLITT